MNPNRIKLLNPETGKNPTPGNGLPVIYWMSRDQRLKDNWALYFAQDLAIYIKSPLLVVFCVVPEFLNAGERQYSFMIQGLLKVKEDLFKKNIPFIFLFGEPEIELPALFNRLKVCAVISDFDPLRIKRNWKNSILKQIKIPFYDVDTHNIVPCWIASNKQEYGAYTLRPKIKKLLPEYLENLPNVKVHPYNLNNRIKSFDTPLILKKLKIDKSVKSNDWIQSGEIFAAKMLKSFIKNKIALYSDYKNDPNTDCLSNLSPFLHFGQISSRNIYFEIIKSDAPKKDKEVFLEELVIRKELADNYCWYNSNYDNMDGFPEWSKKSLNKHRIDQREFIYSREQFENVETHDRLWNAAQTELIKTGKIHGYLRMYWAKKILEWTKNPETAQNIAIYLNDKYALDGRDPNGYTGIAWSIGGAHDRPWFERKIYGMVRYMSYNGCKSKFDVEDYVNRY